MIITVVRHLEPEPYEMSWSDVDRELSDEGIAAAPSLLDNVRAALGEDPSGDHSPHPMRGYGNGYVSPYVRCLSTAELIRPAVGDQWFWYESPLLRESPHAAQVGARGSTVHGKVLTSEESAFDLRDRVSRFLEMVYRPARPVLVVTHGDVVNAFRWCIEGLTLGEFRELFDSPSNFVPFGSAWTFDTRRGVVERRVLGSTTPDMTVDLCNSFWHGAGSYNLTQAQFARTM